MVCGGGEMGWEAKSMCLHFKIITLSERCLESYVTMGWLRLVGSLKLHVSLAKEPYKRVYFLQKRPRI